MFRMWSSAQPICNRAVAAHVCWRISTVRCWGRNDLGGVSLPLSEARAVVWQSRSCANHVAPQSDPAALQSQPPFLVRAGLVGAGTALLTPAFPVIGFNQLVFRFLDPQTRLVLTGGTSILWFSAMTLMPNAFYYAPILLPFALGNGITAAGMYVIAERAAGGPSELAAVKLGWMPLAGPILGLATALLVPFVYPLSWAAVYNEDHHIAVDIETYSMIWDVCFGQTFGWIVWPCLASTGIAAGALIHVFLRPVIVGIPGVPWTKLAGGTLLLSAIGLTALYSTSMRTDVQHLEEVDLTSQEGWLQFFSTKEPCFIRGEEELLWTPALDPRTGEVVSEHRQIKVSPDGRYKYPLDNLCEKGPERSQRARILAAKVKSRRAKCYTSRRAAFFDGLPSAGLPLDPTKVQDKLKGLPVGEAVVTDLLVLVVSGSVPQAKLEESVRLLLPQLKESTWLANHSNNKFWRSWEIDPKVLLSEVALRAAQLRELYRLESGQQPGPINAERLSEALDASGIDVQRAKDSLQGLSWKLHDLSGKRIQDWNVISSRHQRSKFEQAGVILLGIASVGACVHLLNLVRQ